MPLGEDSIKDYKPYLSHDTVPESPHCDTGAGEITLDFRFNCFILWVFPNPSLLLRHEVNLTVEIDTFSLLKRRIYTQLRD